MASKYLIVPMQPTPNGRLHIGHGAGTYLRADILSRALKVRGHMVRTITGSDGFENWVLAEAYRVGVAPELVCSENHENIRRDLHAMDIQFDSWIDPRSEQHFAAYAAVHERILDCMQQSGGASLIEERMPYSTETGEALIGTWIAGECPQCGKACGGSSCVFCGAHFQPEEIVAPRSRLNESTITWKTASCWFAKPNNSNKIIASLEQSGVKSIWMEAVIHYLNRREGKIRLSAPGSWGIPSKMVPEGYVLSNPYYVYSIYCGEVYKQLEGTERNPFDALSKVITVGAFGNDNSTPGLVAPQVIAQRSNGLFKPFDATLVNGMLLLEGEKCSTSKRHGIWLSELLQGSALVNSDEIRYFFAQTALDHGSDNMTLSNLVQQINLFREWIRFKLAPSIEAVTSAAIHYDDGLALALAKQSRWLEPNQFDLVAAMKVLQDWMVADQIETGLWLLGVSLLGFPIMPKLSRQIWERLGLHGDPRIHALLDGPAQPDPEQKWIFAAQLDLTVSLMSPYVHFSGK
ncbi:class I tRNA ligase family protein [Paenibacillus cymbidii]|uniref:class I tRNA ligase family protein n=1 Tax=Paenibacillus cymbidii TaxID=1639034 RepID=UPI001082234D|nr:class I tRNA ligase family protein [Paenibacillus cymbidii]